MEKIFKDVESGKRVLTDSEYEKYRDDLLDITLSMLMIDISQKEKGKYLGMFYKFSERLFKTIKEKIILLEKSKIFVMDNKDFYVTKATLRSGIILFNINLEDRISNISTSLQCDCELFDLFENDDFDSIKADKTFKKLNGNEN